MFARVRMLALVVLVALTAALVVAGAITLADSLQTSSSSRAVLSGGVAKPGQQPEGAQREIVLETPDKT